MRIALCTLDGITYRAADFSLTEGFNDKRRNLVCPECGMRAYYRNYVRNTREAHFGARPHAEGCTQAPLEQLGATGQAGDEDEILTTGHRIVVDFNFGTPEGMQGEQRGVVPVAVGNGVTWGTRGQAVNETMTRRLGPLLRSLMESEEFRRSTQSLEIPDRGEFIVSNFFVNFGDVTENHIGSYHAYWGMVPDASISRRNGALWFNSGGWEDLSVLLDQSHIEATFQRFHIEDMEEISGAYILVFGDLRVSANGMKYVEISDPARFTLRLA